MLAQGLVAMTSNEQAMLKTVLHEYRLNAIFEKFK